MIPSLSGRSLLWGGCSRTRRSIPCRTVRKNVSLAKLDSMTRLNMQSEIVRLWQRQGFEVLGLLRLDASW